MDLAMMKIYLKIRKDLIYIVVLLSLGSIIGMMGCSNLSTENETIQPTVTPGIYHFVTREGITTEVWQFFPGDEDWSIQFQMTSSIDKNVTNTILAEDSERLQTFLETQSPSMSTRELMFEPFIWYQALCSTGQELILVQRDQCCCDPFDQCVGIWKVLDIELSTGRSDIILQEPIEYDVSFDDFLCSPEGRYLALIRYTRNEDNTLVVADRKGNVQELVSERYLTGPMAWSPDGETIVFQLTRPNLAQPENLLRFCSVETGICQDIELGILSVVAGLDWSPDNKKIVFAAISGSTYMPHLYLLDLETKTIQQISSGQKKALEHPHWSPDGKFIAADYKQEQPAWPYWVVTIEVSTGQIVNEFQFPSESSFGKWIWGQDSRTILGLTGQPEFGQEWELVEFSIYDDTSKSITLPDELQGKWVGFYTLGIESIRK
jgi:hypothetical protein